MADINDINSAQTVKIVGAGTTGVEQTPVQSTSDGKFLIERNHSYTRITGATTVVVKNSPGRLNKVVINRPTNGTATIYDNTAGSGTIIASVTFANGVAPTFLEYDLNFNTGLTIVTTGANTDITITYV